MDPVTPFKLAMEGQFRAGLEMLEACLRECPSDQWTSNVGAFPFWQVAYHILYFVDFYLSRDEASFKVRSFHREHDHFFGQLPYPPFETVTTGDPCSRDVLLNYVELCREKVSLSLADESAESLAGESGFWWYKISRAEFHLNNIRHLQHHTAQLSLHLRRTSDIDIAWVGTGRSR